MRTATLSVLERTLALWWLMTTSEYKREYKMLYRRTQVVRYPSRLMPYRTVVPQRLPAESVTDWNKDELPQRDGTTQQMHGPTTGDRLIVAAFNLRAILNVG